ncbi:MAG: thiamine phosphate synthase, partial [Pyrinomonadaceae bacterium]
PEAARRLLGDDAIIGFSTHSLRQAERALNLPIDYLAIGAIFETSTKENPDPTVGLKGLQEVRRAVGDLPLVAIGGITRANAPDVFAAGADTVAVVSWLVSVPSLISRRTRDFLSEC